MKNLARVLLPALVAPLVVVGAGAAAHADQLISTSSRSCTIRLGDAYSKETVVKRVYKTELDGRVTTYTSMTATVSTHNTSLYRIVPYQHQTTWTSGSALTTLYSGRTTVTHGRYSASPVTSLYGASEYAYYSGSWHKLSGDLCRASW